MYDIVRRKLMLITLVEYKSGIKHLQLVMYNHDLQRMITAH